MKRLRTALVPLITATGAFALISVPAMARTPPVVRGSQYLALGDSVTFGYMESQVTPAPNYHNPASFLGYPEQLATALHLMVANAACPGETSSSFINPNAPSNGCENGPNETNRNYRKLYPLHVHYAGSQLAYALSYLRHHHRVRLVSLMLGANDGLRCIETTPDACSSSAERHTFAVTLTNNIHTILRAIRTKAHYRGQIVVLDYYSYDYASSAITGQVSLLNRVENAAARPFHVELADGFAAFKFGSLHSGGDACKAGLRTQEGAGKCGIHPSYAGQALLAEAVEKAIRLA